MITRAKVATVVLCAFIVMGMAVPTLWAFPLLPGQTLPAPSEPNPVGGASVFSGPVPFAAATFSGTLESTVVSGDLSNPLGGLTFTYRLTNAPISPNVISRLTLASFLGWLTDVSWQLQPGPGVPPTNMDRVAIGDVVGFSFVGQPIGAGVIPPGQSSQLLVIQTNAPAYTNGSASVIDGSAVAGVPIYVPTPEPATLAILALGMAGALLRRRTRGRAKH